MNQIMNKINNFVYFGVPTGEGSLGKNDGAKDAPSYLSKLFSVPIENFSLTKNDVEKQQSEIFLQATNIFESKINFTKNKAFFIGGTHDVTFSLFKAFKEKFPSAELLIFDAHVDSDEGLGVVSHEDFVKQLVKQKIVKPKEILIFGGQRIFHSERKFIKLKKIKVTKSTKILKEFLSKSKELYFSFDVDALDKKIMKATGYPENKGVNLVQVEKLLDLIFSSNKVKVFDFVELNPSLITKKEELLLKSILKPYF